MRRIALLASLACSIPCTIYSMEDLNTKVGNIIKLFQHENHFSSRTVNNVTHPAEILVMHYTAETLERTIEKFAGPDTVVSAHYVISEQGTLFQNVADEHAAHHAGLSYWRGITGTPAGSRTGAMNLHSLGIEHVNIGYRANDKQPRGTVRPGDDREWYKFEEPQIQASIKLAQALIAKYKIKQEDVVGHSDIAPKRKVDPGPLFPWHKFAANGVGAWPNPIPTDSARLDCFNEMNDALDVALDKDDDNLSNQMLENWTIEHLHYWGYKKPDQDMSKKPEERASARDIVKAFQMHFQSVDDERCATLGIADYDTAVILNSLLCKYKGTDCPCKN